MVRHEIASPLYECDICKVPMVETEHVVDEKRITKIWWNVHSCRFRKRVFNDSEKSVDVGHPVNQRSTWRALRVRSQCPGRNSRHHVPIRSTFRVCRCHVHYIDGQSVRIISRRRRKDLISGKESPDQQLSILVSSIYTYGYIHGI